MDRASDGVGSCRRKDNGHAVPGENEIPSAVANWLGAPASAENVPWLPVTRWWMPPEVGSTNMTASPAFTVAFPTVKLTEPILMVAAPPALDVAVGASTVAATVGVKVALEAVVVLPQAASASTSARPKVSKGIRIGDPSPHE